MMMKPHPSAAKDLKCSLVDNIAMFWRQERETGYNFHEVHPIILKIKSRMIIVRVPMVQANRALDSVQIKLESETRPIERRQLALVGRQVWL